MKPYAAEKALHSAKPHIEEIRTKKFSIGKTRPNPLTLDLHHAVTSLSAELYQKDIHFLMELIQVYCLVSQRKKKSEKVSIFTILASMKLEKKLWVSIFVDFNLWVFDFQNAEDNEYKKGVEPTLEFVLTKDITGSGAPATLLVFNDDVGFSLSNIDSICSVGRSPKKGKRHLGFIGEKRKFISKLNVEILDDEIIG